jgi:predicted unusual protein kinase regulating ubiquinone biosynthesis (AarF/ABC1/UbiB family)
MFRSRYRRILWFFAGILLNLIWWDILLPRLGLRVLSRRTRPERLRRIAASFRSLAVQMGGVMIKVGQFLSARLDVLPREITDELSGLQDEVRPESFEDVRRVAEDELQSALQEKFLSVDPVPMASASIGQVHSARLRPTGEARDASRSGIPVVIKIQRPHIQEIVEVDLSAIRVVGRWVQMYPPIRKRANVSALLEEFSRSLYEEIDYLAEGKNAETFAENFKDCPEVRVPQVIWSHTTRRVLTLEDVTAIKITDMSALEAAGVNRPEVATLLFDTYLKQIFEDKFFHADPHPGNLFVLPGSKDAQTGTASWRLTFIDFGMVGRVSPNLLAGLREILIAVGTRDASRLVKAYQTLDVVLPEADLGLIEKASSRVFERFWGKTVPEMVDLRPSEAASFINEFGGLLTEMPFQAPENIILLVRCMGILSGICTALDPNFNVWNSIAPYAHKLVEDESGGGLRFWLNELGEGVRPLLSLPRKTETLFDTLQQGRLEVRSPDLKSYLDRLERAIRSLIAAVLLAVFLLSAVQLFLAGQITLARLLGAAAGLCLLILLFRR